MEATAPCIEGAAPCTEISFLSKGTHTAASWRGTHHSRTMHREPVAPLLWRKIQHTSPRKGDPFTRLPLREINNPRTYRASTGSIFSINRTFERTSGTAASLRNFQPSSAPLRALLEQLHLWRTFSITRTLRTSGTAASLRNFPQQPHHWETREESATPIQTCSYNFTAPAAHHLALISP